MFIDSLLIYVTLSLILFNKARIIKLNKIKQNKFQQLTPIVQLTRFKKEHHIAVSRQRFRESLPSQ